MGRQICVEEALWVMGIVCWVFLLDVCVVGGGVLSWLASNHAPATAGVATPSQHNHNTTLHKSTNKEGPATNEVNGRDGLLWSLGSPFLPLQNERHFRLLVFRSSFRPSVRRVDHLRLFDVASLSLSRNVLIEWGVLYY